MKKLMIAMGLAGMLVGCDQPSQQAASPQKSQDTQSTVKKPRFESYGERGVVNTWPPIEKNVPLADSLTAANYYIVVDGSGSMADHKCTDHRSKMKVAIEAIISFIEKLPNNAQVGLFAFDANGIGERLPLGSHSKRQAIDSIKRLRAGGGTPLSTSIQSGVTALTQQGVKQLGYGEYHLVVITDGIASSGFSPDAAVNQLLEGTPIVLHTIGFCIDSNHSLNRPGYTIYKGANNPAALMAGLDSVLAESTSFDVTAFEGAQ